MKGCLTSGGDARATLKLFVMAREWEFLRAKMEGGEYDPVGDLWFVLYFVKQGGLTSRCT